MKAKTKITRLLGILLALVMLVGLMPTVALAEESATETTTADFSDDPTRALRLLNAAKTDGAEKSTWDADSNTLTLNGVNFETTAATAVILPEVKEGVTIVLNGVNTITGGDSESAYCYGIRAYGSLTIEGDGTLIVNCGDTTLEDGKTCGIFASKALNITGGTITANGGTALDYGLSRGIYTSYGNVNISGGTVEVTGDEAQDSSYGIYAHDGSVVIEGGNVKATGGDAPYGSYGIYAPSTSGSVVIKGGTVEATSGAAQDSSSSGIYIGFGSVVIEGGIVNANGGMAARPSCGIYAEYGGSVVISGGTVEATGGTANNGSSFGIYTNSGSVAISGGIVTAKGRTARDGSSCGISAYSGTVTIEGGTVNATAEGGRYANSYGISAYSGTVTISGGALIATGTNRALYIAPNTLPSTYWWRTSNYADYSVYPDSEYTWDSSHNYVEIRDTNPGYTVSFDANDGGGTMEDQTGISGEYTLPANGFAAPAGMQFKAWEVDGIEKAVGDTITIDETTVIKALWEYINYDIGVTGGTASNIEGTPITKAAMGAEVTLTAAEIGGKVFDKWVAKSGNVTFANANRTPTTFTMPAGDVSVEATYATYATSIPSVEITGIDAPVSNTALDITAVCETTGVSTAAPAVTWDTSDSNAGYYKTYTATVTLSADTGYKFADGVTATVNGEPATSAQKNANGTLTVTYEFPKTEKHNIEITFNANGGSVTPASAVTDTDGKLTSLPTPTRSRYSFNGWYTEASGGTKVDTDYVFNANTTIYAHWTYTGGGGGGSTVTTNTVTADSVKNGDVAISPKYAAKGTIVTLKIEPDKGYKLDTVTVTDKNGNKIELTDKGNGEYTFKMPATKVNVETTFVEDTPIEETTTEDNTMMNFFVDVPDDTYYYDAVLWAAKNGITGGMDDTHFAPDITCTRAQAITFLWRAAGSPMPKSSEISFEDVETDSYYYYAVLWALENGITSGTSATTFSPDDTCSRGQIVTFLWRSEKSPTVGMDNTFTDVSSDSYYADATNWAVSNGITRGTSDTTFSPDETCTRAQIVTLLYRFFVK